MTVFQIIALVIIMLGVIVSVGFFVAFLVELKKSENPEEIVAEDTEEPTENEINEIDIDDMLAKLEENSKKKAEEKEEIVVEAENIEEEAAEEKVEEAPVEDSVVEEVSKQTEEVVKEEKVEEEPKTTVIIKKIVKEGPEFDYRVRLDKIKESEEKL